MYTVLYTIIAILSLLVVILSIVSGIYINRSNQSREGLCSCRGLGVAQMIDRKKRMQEYDNGLTEYSDFKYPPSYVYKSVDPPYN